MSTSFAELLAPLTRLRGVLGCLVASEDDGIIIDASVRIGVDADAVAAIAAAIYRKARRSAEASGLARVRYLQLEAERGHLCAAGRGGLVLVTVVESRAHIGLIRSALLRAAEGLE